MFVGFTFSFEPEPNKTESVAKEVSPRAKKVTEVSPERPQTSLFIMSDIFLPECEIVDLAEELKNEIEEFGVSNIEEFFRRRLENWQSVEVNIDIAITGELGSGKSSFIFVSSSTDKSSHTVFRFKWS